MPLIVQAFVFYVHLAMYICCYLYGKPSQYYNLKGGIHWGFFNSSMFNCLHVKLRLAVKYNYKLLVKRRRNIFSTLCMWAYFPRAKHSSFTVDPLAMWTNSGNWTSIFGSYSPITPRREMQMNMSIHAIRGGISLFLSCESGKNTKYRNSPQTKLFTVRNAFATLSRSECFQYCHKTHTHKTTTTKYCSSGHATHRGMLGKILWEFMEG